MNRNQIYEYLRGIDELKTLTYKMGKGYNLKFVPKIWIQTMDVYINDIVINNVYSITLLIQKVILQGEIGEMEIHINYRDMGDFVVVIEE